VDVYDAIPTIVTTFVAIIAKISIFIFLLELVYHTNSYISEFSWTYALLISSLLSLIIGTVVGLTQFRIKRLLAYSTISHVGFILLALSVSSIESTQAFIFYLIQYTISNLNAFFIIITIGFSLYGYITNNKEYKSLLDKNNSPALRCGKPLIRDLWPNSGELLKLLVPSQARKCLSDWTNYSDTVISQEINERTMEYRGSKSAIFEKIAVKEQRVDGHRCINSRLIHLRYALMGFERNYQIRIPSNQLITLRRSYSSIRECETSHINLYNQSKFHNLNPWYLTGFSDGESNFTVRIFKSNTTKLGWTIQPVFQIMLHKRDLDLLKKIQGYFGVGEIYHKEQASNYTVQSLKGIKVIINHFEKYPLFTKKREDFILFTQIVNLMDQKEHLTLSGLHKIISLRASMNLGLSPILKTAFPDIIPAIRPKRSDEFLLNSTLDPNWVVGFTDAEGCFTVKISKSLSTKTGLQVQLRYQITQGIIDKVFMNNLAAFWGCGKVFLRFKQGKVDFQILKFKDLTEKVVPLFQNIPLEGTKQKDFEDFCKAVEIMKQKGHLTNEGISLLYKLKIGMNKGRE
jgi:hypothetical protein